MSATTAAASALQTLNNQWFSKLKTRWIDVVGAYAGKELFLVDGFSLIRHVLDDPLLRLGVDGSLDAQLLHAVYSAEAFLQELTRRGAVYQVIFFDSHRYTALTPTGSSWATASRTLATSVLEAHIDGLDIETEHFDSPEDEDWEEYVVFNKPLFILADDGGAYSAADDVAIQAALRRRHFMGQIMNQGISVASLRDIDYRDSQVLTFVYDRTNYDSDDGVDSAVEQAYKALVDRVRWSAKGLSGNITTAELDTWIQAAVKAYLPTAADDPIRLALIWVFVAHTVLLKQLPLDLRSQPEPKLPSALLQVATEQVLPALFGAFALSIPDELEGAPPLDGRIYAILLSTLLEPNAQPAEVLGAEAFEKTKTLWASISSSQPDLAALQSLATETLPPSEASPDFDDFPLYPFDNPAFNEAFESIEVSTRAVENLEALPQQNQKFTVPSIFASARRRRTERAVAPRHLGGDEGRPKDRKAKERLLRSNQRFMTNLERQAKSLTGAKGAPLDQEVITSAALTSGRNTRPSTRPASPDSTPGSRNSSKRQPTGSKGAGGKKGKEAPLKSADKLRAQIEAQKKAKAVSETETWWQQRLKELQDIEEVPARIEMLELQLKNKRVAEDRSLAAGMWLFRIHLELYKWVEDVKKTEPAVQDAYTIRLVTMVKNIAQYQSVFTPTMVKALWSVLEAIGFDDYIEIIAKPAKDIADKKLPFDFVRLYQKGIKVGPNDPPPFAHPWMRIKENPVDWQLRIYGEHMERSFDSKPDDRVKFEPDAWQREVLDKLDRDDSLLVVAPTSAGKTFISYYAMKQVLTASDDSILVYVAPTKPLVTQIAAEVYARYRKDMKGRSCWAVYTADQRINNPTNCQILVTVPEMLAYMLLTPHLARAWAPKIKRIILDEIHMLGSQKGGVWEHILLLATCPIIGLSATVGEAEVFNEWLKSVQEAHGHRHSFIQHKHRYSHLRKFSYVLTQNPEPVAGLIAHKGSDQTRFLHPISFLRPGITSIPDDLALEARDCGTLYLAMKQESKDPVLDNLSPQKFFEKSNGTLLQQRDIIRYETALKAKLQEWISAPDAHSPRSTIQRVVKQLSDPVVGSAQSEASIAAQDPFYSNLFNFVADLNASGDLPALLFHFDRYTVEGMAKALLERLEKDEAEWRKTSPEWEKKIKGWEIWQAGAKEREKAAQRAALKTAKAEGDKMDRLQQSAAVDTSPYAIYASFDPDAPSEEFSFTNWGSRYSVNELDEDVKELDRWTTTPKFLLACLRRGIAVHHSGLNKRYRALVESLFRIGFLRVVISTEDLALGVNMPAKASVFCGDSPALTALMYRQCAGRAGRRGFDLLGKVIFYGIPHERVRQVVLSRLPALRGNYPLTPSLSLRLANLLSESSFAPVALSAVQTLFKLPRLTVGSDIGREQTVHQLRFSIEYLIRAQLLDLQGTPLHPWYSIAAYLSTAEPANFALLALFRSGYLHTVCEDPSVIEAKRRLMHLLAFLFNRDYLSKSVIADEETFNATNRSPSKVILPPLDKDVYKVLSRHNADVLDVFTESAITFSMQQSRTLGPDSLLPLSNQNVNPAPAASSTSPDSKFIANLKATRTAIRSRSAFVATSGHGDVYGDVDELVRTARTGVNLNKQVLPYFDTFAPGATRESRYINAYLYDFYNHGQDKPLVQANNIPRGEVWYRLQEFSMVLASIVASLAELVTRDHKAEEAAASGAGESTSGPAVASGDVVDDWLADADADEALVPTSGKAVPNSGGSSLPMEKEKGDEAEAAAAISSRNEGALIRPPNVPEKDWKVYEVFVQLQDDFNQKFGAMWA